MQQSRSVPAQPGRAGAGTDPRCTDRAPHGAERVVGRRHLGSGCCLTTAATTVSRSPQTPSCCLHCPAESDSTKNQGSCWHKVLLTPRSARSLPLCPRGVPSSTHCTTPGKAKLPQPPVHGEISQFSIRSSSSLSRLAQQTAPSSGRAGLCCQGKQVFPLDVGL